MLFASTINVSFRYKIGAILGMSNQLRITIIFQEWERSVKFVNVFQENPTNLMQ